MSDRAMSEEAMVTSLRDIHLPAEAAGGLIADVSVAVGLASLVALLIAATLRFLSLKRPRQAQSGLQQQVAGLADLPEAARRVALLHLLRARHPTRYSEIRGALYEPGGGVDTATLEAEVNRLA